jgi:SAM-dependent methyltransferase
MKNPWEKIYRDGRSISKFHQEIENISNLLVRNECKRILDLGCGTGRHLIYLAEKGFELYGLDSSPTGLAVILQKLYKKNLTAHLSLHDILDLPYEDNFFDALISIQVIHHNKTNNIRRTIREISRVLREGGILWVTIPVTKNEPSTKQKEIEPGTFIPLNGEEKGLPHHYFKKHEISSLFKDFTILDVHKDNMNHYSILAKKKIDYNLKN